MPSAHDSRERGREIVVFSKGNSLPSRSRDGEVSLSLPTPIIVE